MSDLHEKLTSVHGIGDAKADELMEIIESQGSGGNPEILENVQTAIEYIEEGQPNYALKFLYRVVE